MLAVIEILMSGWVGALTALNRIGQPTQEEVAVAVALSEGIPADLQTVLRDSAGAQAGIFAVVLSGGPGARSLEETVFSSLTDHQTIATASGIAASAQCIDIVPLEVSTAEAATGTPVGSSLTLAGSFSARSTVLINSLG